ncbi:nucleoside diphosphate-linked moiety X motif 17 isoform X7 [Rissa tridactyla]|uniref:nucleoside diphosphate-linked moiety X motif 17 isoform X7 n=1 Tax=Rissa tridactyla TaxID=75485 RepID=UPI0023BB1362|nr:nucleoside diphosphate-linked moiety X motif 17 isoform X7 [Rissa tridactyla]
MAVVIMVPGWWPLWCHGSGHGGCHHHGYGSSHHGGHQRAIAVPIIGPWQWQPWCQRGGPCGAMAVAMVVVIVVAMAAAMVVAITVAGWCHGGGRVLPALPSPSPPQSVTGTFCPAQEDVAVVSCGLDRGRFLLSDVAFPGSTPALLKRPSFCPAKLLGEREAAAIPAELRGRGVAAGVAVLLRASTGHILLTRRAPTLSIFPGLWVPPGGHVEPGEELLDVGLRELEEETGLRLEAGTFSWRMLGLWESIYPPMLSRGLPRRHHIVTYLLLLCQEPHQGLDARMRPSESEVSAYAWLEPPVLEAIAATEDGAETLSNVPSELPATVSITEVSGGSSSTTQLPTATLLNTAPAEGEDVERVSTGTKFALRLCLESLRERGQVQPSGGVTPLP